MTIHADVLELLKKSVQEISDFEGEITESTYLPELQLDSLDYVAIQLEVKRHLGVDINYEDFADGSIQTVGDFVRYVDRRHSELESAAVAQPNASDAS